jgi:sulfite exporter TauE/SafE/copper chaperone CopZ
MKKCQIDIKGMHCRSCEILIADELVKIPGIEEVVVDQNLGTAEIYYLGKIKHHRLVRAVAEAGYQIGKEERPLISKNVNDYKDLGIAFFIIIALYSIAKNFGLFDLSSSISGAYSSLGVVFLVGLTAGVSTCMALVGGLILGASARFSEDNPKSSKMEKFTPHLVFNLGRVISYFILGGVIGYAGSFFQISSSFLGLMTIIVGLVMLLLGGQLIDIFPFLKRFSFTMPSFIGDFLGVKDRSGQEYSHKNSFTMGALTFFLPCGFTQAMQLFAIKSGNPIVGALTMGIFALGTVPGLLGIGGLTSVLKKESSKLFFKTAGVIVISLAFFNISNGLNLVGFNPRVLGASQNITVKDPNISLVNGVQEARMKQLSGGYRPNSFTIQKGIPVRWIITSEDLYTCASSLIVQKLGIRKSLQLGENIIEFTPSELGTIRFSCSMGMYTGSFTVIN